MGNHCILGHLTSQKGENLGHPMGSLANPKVSRASLSSLGMPARMMPGTGWTPWAGGSFLEGTYYQWDQKGTVWVQFLSMSIPILYHFLCHFYPFLPQCEIHTVKDDVHIPLRKQMEKNICCRYAAVLLPRVASVKSVRRVSRRT